MNNGTFNAPELVARLSAPEMEQVLCALVKRVWAETPPSRPGPHHVKDADGKVIGLLVYPAPDPRDPEVAKSLEEARRRLDDPNTKYIPFDEFVERFLSQYTPEELEAARERIEQQKAAELSRC